MVQEEERKGFVRDDISEFSQTNRRERDYSPESAYGGSRSARQAPLEALGLGQSP